MLTDEELYEAQQEEKRFILEKRIQEKLSEHENKLLDKVTLATILESAITEVLGFHESQREQTAEATTNVTVDTSDGSTYRISFTFDTTFWR